ncbi:L-asparaginase 1 isoform X2 [Dermatophagoides farinae]|uniref:L-asparaginase 1 isoform X2 n=1 Tax=Dermatophagoides farinae TaxID=6954 RepID=UPI003F619A19
MTDKLFSEDSCDSDAELLNNLPLNGGLTNGKTKNRQRRLSLNLAQTIPQQKLIDPSFEPKVLRKNKSIARIESYGTLAEESKVLVIYTGGTIGMVKNGSGVYEPRPGAFTQVLKKYPQLHDSEYFEKSWLLPDSEHLLVLPDTGEKKRVIYTIFEYDPLLDSSNMTIDDWVLIAQNIKKEYHRFNGFVILHGTDTMAYTASALSFMLENLGKTVVITGSQIPLFEARSDAKENLLNSLIIAGNYSIPEVAILFNNKLFRGNRTSKISASKLDAFNSPNMSPLVNIGIKIDVDWNNVYRPSTIAKVHVHSKLNRNVTLLRLFPSITVETIRVFLREPIEGVVLQTYGAGNAPSNRKDILNEFREATKRGLIIVNITQCPNGKVDPSYETGNALIEAGVIPGSDMTPEACLAKLSYILSKDEWSLEKKREMVRTNLRGEMTVIRERRVEDVSLVQAIASTLKVSTSDEIEKLRSALYPAIVCAITARGDVESLIQLKKNGIDLCACDYDMRTPLHIAVSHGHKDVVKYLLFEGVNVHAKDKNNETPLHLAIKNQQHEIIKMLIEAGASLDLPKNRIGDLITNAAANGKLQLLRSLRLAGATLEEKDTFGRQCIHAVCLHTRG